MTATEPAVDVFDELESAVRTYCRRFPAVFARAKGHRMWDEDGREYVDFLSGAGALNCPALQKSMGSSDLYPPPASAVRACTMGIMPSTSPGRRTASHSRPFAACIVASVTALATGAWPVSARCASSAASVETS